MERERITIRVEPRLLGQIREDLKLQQQTSADPAQDVTEWIHRAAREYLGHRKRARASSRARSARRQAALEETRYTLAPEHERGSYE